MWDPKMATAAAAVEQCLSLGGVILTPPKKPTGFGGKK